MHHLRCGRTGTATTVDNGWRRVVVVVRIVQSHRWRRRQKGSMRVLDSREYLGLSSSGSIGDGGWCRRRPVSGTSGGYFAGQGLKREHGGAIFIFYIISLQARGRRFEIETGSHRSSLLAVILFRAFRFCQEMSHCEGLC